MAAFFFASPVDIDIKLEGEDVRKQVDLKLEKERKESCPVYYDGDSIVGQVRSLFGFCGDLEECSELHVLYVVSLLTGYYTCKGREEVDA